MPGIDGKVALAEELDRLSAHSDLARRAPRGTGIARYLADGINAETSNGVPDGEFWDMAVHLIQRLSIWWPVSAYAVLPVLTPWCIRDRSARWQHGPESWGAPRADGYLRDDNSIIKKLPLPLLVDAPGSSPYRGQKPWRGFTACHIWRDLEDGTVGGVDQWVYSFMPNLVWLPSPLSPLTDHHPRVQALLQRTSQQMFHGRELIQAPVSRYSDYVWSKLVPRSAEPSSGPMLDLGELAFFDVDAAFVKRRLIYVDTFVDGVDRVLAGQSLRKKIICSRYTAQMPLLEHDALAKFRTDLDDYRAAVRAGL
ncbi:hypothetical protein OMK64_01810 [Cellulomonas fimi]|uniref:hypothetical protein n=1 Tax=Cellulomonas fimi TaxID=1708 RepID=UPI00234DB8F4|nr:hypothetical protein [Cellulomonas fimi]MDC7120268.1 hypothetical protein [Cellulomonas fimi]